VTQPIPVDETTPEENPPAPVKGTKKNQDRAIQIVLDFVNTNVNVDTMDYMVLTADDILVIFFAKTSSSWHDWRCILKTADDPSRLYEVSYDGGLNVTKLTVFHASDQIIVPPEESQ
jgi:hypothetical protein